MALLRSSTKLLMRIGSDKRLDVEARMGDRLKGSERAAMIRWLNGRGHVNIDDVEDDADLLFAAWQEIKEMEDEIERLEEELEAHLPSV